MELLEQLKQAEESISSQHIRISELNKRVEQAEEQLRLEKEVNKKNIQRLKDERTELDVLLTPLDLAIRKANNKENKGFWLFGVLAWANALNEVLKLSKKVISWRNERVLNQLGIDKNLPHHLPMAKRLNA